MVESMMQVKFLTSNLGFAFFISLTVGSRSHRNKTPSLDSFWGGANGEALPTKFVTFLSSLESQDIDSGFQKFQIPWYPSGTREKIWGDHSFYSFPHFQESENGKSNDNRYFENPNKKGKFRQIFNSKSIKFISHGCDDEWGFHFEGETWYSRGCRRHKCIHLRGKYFVETDSCDVEIFNTTYKCIVQVNLEENFPNCCPRYICNPDNLGNRIHVAAR